MFFSCFFKSFGCSETAAVPSLSTAVEASTGPLLSSLLQSLSSEVLETCKPYGEDIIELASWKYFWGFVWGLCHINWENLLGWEFIRTRGKNHLQSSMIRWKTCIFHCNIFHNTSRFYKILELAMFYCQRVDRMLILVGQFSMVRVIQTCAWEITLLVRRIPLFHTQHPVL